MKSSRILSGLNPDDYPGRTIAVAMSGGVDSSLAAILLVEAGFDVVGLTMSLWNYESSGLDHDRACCDLSAFDGARAVAHAAGIPHYTLNLRDTFEETVIRNFVSEYLDGRTPNPCIACNTRIKWDALVQKARALGCDLIATGHYARISRGNDGAHFLLRGIDTDKDQSYFLWGLSSEKLAMTLFPLGGMTKEETRREALHRNLATAKRRESQEICFIPDNDYGRFLRGRFPGELPVPLTEGSIYTLAGDYAGKHHGAAYYTVGQRRGIGIALGRPIYVTRVDTKTNTVIVGDDCDLFAANMTVTDIVWGGGSAPEESFHCLVKIRYRHNGDRAEVTPEGNTAVIRFDAPQRAITPGQSAVFYDGDTVLGGGIIAEASQ